MGKPTGFLDYARMDCPARSVEARVADWAPLDLPLSEKNRRRQSGRCMDCGVPFCQAGVTFDGALLGCPLHNLIPEWNDLLWNGNYEGALQRLLKTSPFPEFTARVCPALCEKACVCGRVSQPVTVRENELAIIEYAFENDLMQPMPPAARSDKRIAVVGGGAGGGGPPRGGGHPRRPPPRGGGPAPPGAVVGSGPAGLSAAYYLNRRGHHVTVFERDPLPGGLLTYGIPEMKLPKQIVARRISLLEQEGVVFRTNCCVGRDLSPEALAAEFDLAIFCCGAQQPRPLPFAEAGGVFYALDYLRASAQALLAQAEPAVTAAGKHVVLVGAGDSASDCVSVALRQGCRSLTQLIRKPRTASTEKRDHAHEEAEAVFGADIRHYETQIDSLSCGTDGAVSAVTLRESGEQLPCDLLLLASGFSGCEAASLEACEAVRQAGIPVLTAGDMASGASLVVLAIASGKQAAARADASLMGYTNIL